MKAIGLAALAETACTYAYSFLAPFTVVVVASARGVAREHYHHTFTGPIFLGAGFLAGTASALLAGFIAARIARTRELLHAALAALPCMLLGLVLKLTLETVPGIPTWYTILSFAVVIPAAVAGGHLGVQRKHALAAAAIRDAPVSPLAPAP